MKCCEKIYYFNNKTIYYNLLNDVIKMDLYIIPTVLMPYLNNINKLKIELSKINNIKLRKDLITLSSNLKIAKTFIAKGQKGGNIKIPWKNIQK